MHESGVFVMRLLGVPLRVVGIPPERGLLVANHLSYLDILVFSTALPCCLVSKAEIGKWPFFGTLARAGGTIFLDRGSHASAEQVVRQMAEHFALGVPVLLFPEGTSTDGSQLLRFRPRLFAPAVEAGAPVTAASVRYIAQDGSAERELCWFGDAVFLTHLWKTLGGPDFSVEIQFGEPQVYTNARAAASQTQAEVEAMRGTAG